MSNTLIYEAAIQYGLLGLKVVPLAPGEKRPTQVDWIAKATADPQRNKQRFERYDRNIGLLMGPTEDGRFVFAIDEDPKNGGKGCLKKFLGKKSLPDTATALTPSGGSHRLFYAPSGVTVTSHTGDNGLAPGIDILGENSQIVVEPSTFKGKEYVWVRHPSQGIAQAPAWLIARIIERQGKALPAPTSPPKASTTAKPALTVKAPVQGQEGALLQDALARFQVRGKGQRNRQLYRLVSCLACQGLQDETILSTVRAWWDHWHQTGNAADPADDKQILRQVACARKALEAEKLSPSGSQNHRLAFASRSLSPAQEEAVSSLIIIRTLTGQERQEKLCAGKLDRAFVGACLLHFRYEQERFPGSVESKATNAQLRELMAEKFGVVLTDNNWRILKARFVGKDGSGARRFPLLRMVFQGSREAGGIGVPSRYTFEAKFEELLALAAPSLVPALPAVELAEAPVVAEKPDEDQGKTDEDQGKVTDMSVTDMSVTRQGLRVVRRESDISTSPTSPNLRGIMLGIRRMLDAGDISYAEWESAVASIDQEANRKKGKEVPR